MTIMIMVTVTVRVNHVDGVGGSHGDDGDHGCRYLQCYLQSIYYI